ncbi:unnamed protein product [Prorocentrum cordatum]|uniref:YCII-related domain-containing protein n=1 Tax=Prorocentrum cordatum TaxID=2364126 RepID=A0ABN9TCM4_9DINO|nr:unnamed protein product [Polarella glacialis]
MGSKDGFTTMKSHLQALQDEDPEAIFIVLKEHFSTYGEVKGIHVCHSRVKSGNTRDAGGDEFRKRPAALGFVVMETAEAAKRILEAGPEIEVKDVKVLVQPFNRNHGAEGEASSGGATQGGGPQKRARTDGAAVPKTGSHKGRARGRPCARATPAGPLTSTTTRRGSSSWTSGAAAAPPGCGTTTRGTARLPRTGRARPRTTPGTARRLQTTTLPRTAALRESPAGGGVRRGGPSRRDGEIRPSPSSALAPRPLFPSAVPPPLPVCSPANSIVRAPI